MKIAGVILAGGLARRMGGGDKALLELAGETLLARVIARLKPQVGEMVLNANGDPARFAEFGLPVVADTVEGFAGPLAGILAGMRWAAAKGYSHVASAAGDTPFFPADLVARGWRARCTPAVIRLPWRRPMIRSGGCRSIRHSGCGPSIWRTIWNRR
jgi:molybdopterin-guanine dinucleotide biosynthesis protein A